MSKSISVVIPCYNGAEMLRKTLPNLFTALETVPDYEVIVIDDASKDDSYEFVSKNYPQINLLQNTANSGFSPTINRGIKIAQKDLVLCLNTDVWLAPDYFERISKHFEEDAKSEIFAVMGAIWNEQGDKLLEGVKSPYIHKNGLHFNDCAVKTGKIYTTAYACGGNAIFDREKLQSLGGYNEWYKPFYYEDVDVSLRAYLKGWKCLYDTDATCRHVSGDNIRKSFMKKYIRMVNRRNFLMLNYIYLSGELKSKFDQMYNRQLKTYKFLKFFGLGDWTAQAYIEFEKLRKEIPVKRAENFDIEVWMQEINSQDLA